MTELFTNLPDEVKRQDQLFVDLTFKQSDPFEIVNILNEYVQSCINEEEKNFLDFYINLKLEQMKNESFPSKR